MIARKVIKRYNCEINERDCETKTVWDLNFSRKMSELLTQKDSPKLNSDKEFHILTKSLL